MNYKELDLQVKEDTVSLMLSNNVQVKVLQYLPIEDKIDLIQISLQKALENNIYNEMKLDMYFNLNIIYMYTDLVFTQEDREDEFKLYNELQSNDIINMIIGAIDEYEYNELTVYLEKTKENNEKYRTSLNALVKTFVEDLPRNVQTAGNIMESFDMSKYPEVIKFAQSANGGRPIENLSTQD